MKTVLFAILVGCASSTSNSTSSPTATTAGPNTPPPEHNNTTAEWTTTAPGPGTTTISTYPWWLTTTTYNHLKHGDHTTYADDHHDDGCNEDKCANDKGCWVRDHEDSHCYEGYPEITGATTYDEEEHVTYHHFRCCGGDDHHDDGCNEDKCANAHGCWAADHEDSKCHEGYPKHTGDTHYDEGEHVTYHHFRCCGGDDHHGGYYYYGGHHGYYHYYYYQPQPQPLTEADKSIIMVVLQALLQYLLYFIKLLTGQH